MISGSPGRYAWNQAVDPTSPDALHPRERGAALDHDRVQLRRDLGEDGVAHVGGERSAAHRGKAERQIVGAPKDRRLLVARPGADQHARQELELAEGGAVSCQRSVRLHAARDVAEDGAWEEAARGLLEIVQAQYSLEPARRRGCLPRRDGGTHGRLICLCNGIVHDSSLPQEAAAMGFVANAV